MLIFSPFHSAIISTYKEVLQKPDGEPRSTQFSYQSRSNALSAGNPPSRPLVPSPEDTTYESDKEASRPWPHPLHRATVLHNTTHNPITTSWHQSASAVSLQPGLREAVTHRRQHRTACNQLTRNPSTADCGRVQVQRLKSDLCVLQQESTTKLFEQKENGVWGGLNKATKAPTLAKLVVRESEN